MQWLLQNSGLTFDALDRNTEPLVCALDEKGIEKYAVGVIPFTEIVTGLEGIDLSRPTIFYGSTRLAELAPALAHPGAFYKPEWFDPMYPIGKTPYLLNTDAHSITVLDLRNRWVEEPSFVKSVDPKKLTGMVLEGPDRSWWMEEHENLDDSDLLVVSPVHKIDQEWRFFIVEGEVVAGSQYKHDGILRIREPIDPYVWDVARAMASVWLPHPTVVMDVCRSGFVYRIVEFNCVNSSGFYNANVGDIVDAFESAYGR